MTSANISRDEQYALVYQGIAAVAANCDGAFQQDGVGFNGQDTKFGKRIAAVPFEMWTDDVKEEAARIALTYKQQILAYTGVDVAQLDVVREANDWDTVNAKRGLTNHSLTNHNAREQARGFAKISRRQVRVRDEQCLVFDFPFDAELKDQLKAAARVQWNPGDKTWEIGHLGVTPELAALAKANFVDITPEAAAMLDAAPAAPAVAPKPVVHGYIVNGEVVFDFPYNAAQKDAIKGAGARWNGADKTWRVRTTDPKATDVVAAARQVGLTVATEVDVALGGAQKAAEVKLDRKATLVAASRISKPSELPVEFLALVAEAVA